jgi:hypothetical protein
MTPSFYAKGWRGSRLTARSRGPLVARIREGELNAAGLTIGPPMVLWNSTENAAGSFDYE